MSSDLLRAARVMSARLDHLRELAGDMRAAVEGGACAALLRTMSSEAGEVAEAIRATAERLAPGVERERAYRLTLAGRGGLDLGSAVELRDAERVLLDARAVEAPCVSFATGRPVYVPGEGYGGDALDLDAEGWL